jgi:hypothetical protein
VIIAANTLIEASATTAAARAATAWGRAASTVAGVLVNRVGLGRKAGRCAASEAEPVAPVGLAARGRAG